MTTTKEVNKEAIRILVKDVGYDETSKRTGIKAGTLRQWARRFHWHTPFVHSQAVTTVTQSPADAHATILAEHERKTKLGLASYAATQADHLAKNGKLKDSGHVHNVAKTAAIVHRWDAKSENTQNVVVNVALLGVQPHEVSVETLDVESGVSE